jgi:hypothetical protein
MNLLTRDPEQRHRRKWDVTLGGYREWVNWFAALTLCPEQKYTVLLNPGMPSPTFRQDATTPHLTARHPRAQFESTESFFAMPSGFFLWKAVNNQQAKIKYEIRLRSMFCGYLCRRGFAG